VERAGGRTNGSKVFKKEKKNRLLEKLKRQGAPSLFTQLLAFPPSLLLPIAQTRNMAQPTEKEISVPSPGKAAIPVLLTSPPKGVKHSGFGLLLGPGAGTANSNNCIVFFNIFSTLFSSRPKAG